MIINKLIQNKVDLHNVNEINNFVNKLVISNNSKRIYLHSIKHYLEANNMSTQGLLNLTQEFKAIRNQLNFDEFTKIQKLTKTCEMDFVFNALIETGCRISEFINIDWLNLTKTEIGIKTLKTNNSYRFVFINESTLKLLNELKSQNYEFKKLTAKRVQYLLAKLGNNANLEINLSPHVLRRTKGSFLRMNGCVLEDIADLLGHQNLETTRKYYTKMNPDYLKSISKISDIKPTESMDLQSLISELKVTKRKCALLEIENESLKNKLGIKDAKTM